MTLQGIVANPERSSSRVSGMKHIGITGIIDESVRSVAMYVSQNCKQQRRAIYIV